MSRDELRNEARFHMYDDDDNHQSLFEAFVSHTAKDLGPIDKDWFAKERASQISECSGFRSSGNASSNTCTPVVSPCLSHNNAETPKSGGSTPKSAASCQRNISMLEWTPLSPSPSLSNLFKAPGVPKTLPQSLGVNTATPSPHWSPSLETPPIQRARAKGDGKVLAPKNLFHLPTKNQQSLSSEVEDVLEDEEFKDVLSDEEENSALIPDGATKEDLAAPRILSTQKPPRGDSCLAPKEASPIICKDGFLLGPQHSQRASQSADVSEVTSKRGFTSQDSKLSPNGAKLRKNEHILPDAAVCEAEKLAVAGKCSTVASDIDINGPLVACQPAALLNPLSRVEDAANALDAALIPPTTPVHNTASRELSLHNESLSSVSKDFSFMEDKNDCDFGKADLSLTQMFEVAESTIACLEATDVGFTQCTSSSSEVNSDHFGAATKMGKAKWLRIEEKLNSEQLMSCSNFDDSSISVLPKPKIESCGGINNSSSQSLKTSLSGKDHRLSTGFKTGSGKPVVVLESSLSTAKGMLLMADEASGSNGKNKQFASSVRSPAEPCKIESLREPLRTGYGGNTAAQPVSVPEQGEGPATHASEWNNHHTSSNSLANGLLDERVNNNSDHDIRCEVIPSVHAAAEKEDTAKVLTGFKTASGAAVRVLKSSVLFAKNSLAGCAETEDNVPDACNSLSTTTGFATTGGITVLKSSLSAAKSIFTECDSMPTGLAQNKSLETPNTDTAADKGGPALATGDIIRCPETASGTLLTSRQCMEASGRNPESSTGSSSAVLIGHQAQVCSLAGYGCPKQSALTSGFTTAGGKPVYIQEEGLNRARQLLSKVSAESTHEGIQEKTVPTLFTTGTGKLVNVSVDSLKKSAAPQSAFTSGFATASGKPVHVQEEALNQARHLLSEAPAHADKTVPAFLTIGPGKKVDVSVDSLNKSKAVQGTFTSGFAMAGGKPVLIKEGALDQARQLLLEATAHADKIVPTYFTTGSGKKVDVSVDSLKKSEAQQGLLTSGFMTAGGKTVFIQEEGLNHAHQLFSDATANISENSPQLKTVPTFFSTGSGKTVEVSTDSLKKSKKLLGEMSHTPPSAAHLDKHRDGKGFLMEAAGLEDASRVLTSFSTGLGQAASVSKNSLSSAQNVLSDRRPDVPSQNLTESKKDGAPFGKKETSRSVAHAALESIQKPPIYDSTVSDTDCKKERDLPTSKQESARPGAKHCTPSTDKAQPSPSVLASFAASDKKTPVATMSRQGHAPSPMFASKLRPAVKTPSFVTPFKTVGFGKAGTPVAPRSAVSGPRSLFHRKAIQPGKLWILRRATKAPRLSLVDALQGERPKFYSLEQLKGYGVLESTTTISSENAADFVFHVSSSDSLLILGDGATVQLTSTEVMLGRDEFYRAFLSMPGVDGKLVSPSWLDNHYRWIVWKLAAMELHCPQVFGGRSFTPDQVMLQLKYRYDIEIDHSCRSALRKIYERDDISSKSLVLCVSAVTVKEDGAVQLELTDGWYGIRAELDEPLSKLASTGRIFVGLKILASGAELVGSSEACAPLEAPQDLVLKLSYNSTRRARWDTRLGYFLVPRPFRVSLSSLHPKGGLAGRVDCLVIRVYPIMYLEMLPNGMGVMRHEMEELVIAAKHEKLRAAFTEKLTAEVLSQVEKTDTEELSLSGIQMSYSVKQIQGLSSGKDIWKAMRNSSDPLEIERILTEEQVHILRSFQEEQLCRRQADIQQQLELALQAAMDENRCPKERVVIPVLKVLVGGIHEEDLRKNICCLLCVWRPTDDARETLKQGRALSVYNVNVTSARKVLPDVQNSAVELSTTKTTQFEPADCPDHIRIYYMRQVTSFPVLLKESGSQGRAVDIVGFVLRISHQKEGAVLTLADAKLNFVQLVADKKALAVGDSIEKGQFISATDVTLRTGSGERIATLETTEFSLVTSSPKSSDLQHSVSALKASIPDPTGFAAAALARLQAPPARLLSPAVPRQQCATPVVARPLSTAMPIGTTLAKTPSAATRVTPKQSGTADFDGLVLPKKRVEVEPGSPAEALQKQIRSRIALLGRYAALEPTPFFTIPPSAKATTLYQRPKMAAPHTRAQESPPRARDSPIHAQDCPAQESPPMEYE